MQSFRYLVRARAWPAAGARGRAGPRLAGLLVMAAVSLAAVLAGSVLVHGRTGGAAGRPGMTDRSAVAGRPGGVRRPGPAVGPAPSGQPRAIGPQQGTAAPGAGPGGGSGGAVPSVDARAGLAARLGEILRLRERAYARRDATVLDTIYTADCACLRSGRAAIARLLADHAVWRGRSVAVRVERLSRVSDSLWIALAVLRRGAFRIEREDGTLLSAEPAARQRYRFALVRTGTATWLLGHASLVEELPP
jgi:hypothetical protein